MLKRTVKLGSLVLLVFLCGMPLDSCAQEARGRGRRAARQQVAEQDVQVQNMRLSESESEREIVDFTINKKGSSMVNLGMDYQKQAQMAESLNTLLAHEYVLYTETLNFHWNVRGKHFGPLHELFGKQYEQLLGIADRVAERVRALGGFSLGTLPEFLEKSTLIQKPGSSLDDMSMIAQLLEDHEAVIKLMRGYSEQAAQARDEGSVNMLGDLIETHEKMAWMLRSHLE